MIPAVMNSCNANNIVLMVMIHPAGERLCSPAGIVISYWIFASASSRDRLNTSA